MKWRLCLASAVVPHQPFVKRPDLQENRPQVSESSQKLRQIEKEIKSTDNDTRQLEKRLVAAQKQTAELRQVLVQEELRHKAALEVSKQVIQRLKAVYTLVNAVDDESCDGLNASEATASSEPEFRAILPSTTIDDLETARASANAAADSYATAVCSDLNQLQDTAQTSFEFKPHSNKRSHETILSPIRLRKRVKKVNPETNLAAAVTRHSRSGKIPALVERCIAAVEKRGLRTRQIYQENGNRKRVRALKKRFFSKREKHLPNLMHVSDIYIVADCLRLYLSELHESLIIYDLYEGFIRAVDTVRQFEKFTTPPHSNPV